MAISFAEARALGAMLHNTGSEGALDGKQTPNPHFRNIPRLHCLIS